jgi:hypothetical protein
MSLLPDFKGKLKYTPEEDGNLVPLFYVPALKCANRYDRSTGFFSATALTLAALGIEGLVRNDGHMRLIVGCTLHEEEVEAIRKGEELRATVEAHLGNMPLQPDNPDEKDALELLARIPRASTATMSEYVSKLHSKLCFVTIESHPCDCMALRATAAGESGRLLKLG